MKARLTLQEKLRDLRDERGLKLTDLSDETGIPTATLQRFESDNEIRVGYQDIFVLARFYNVSADYLFGLTDNRQHRNIEIDKLLLSDLAIEVLKNGKLNNRLISEFLSHEDFPKLLNSMEVYIDRKVMPQMNQINAMYEFAEQTIKENFDVSDDDEWIQFLQQSVVNEDEYLRFRISERFNIIMKKMFDSHKKDVLSGAQNDFIKDLKSDYQTYAKEKDEIGKQRAKLALHAKQLGFNIAKLTDEELRIFMKTLENTDVYKRTKKRK